MSDNAPLIAEIVGYTLPEAGWAALRTLLRLPDPLHALETDARPRDGLDCLYDMGLATPAGERVIVDELFAFLLTELSQADIALSFRAGDARLTLCRCPRLYIMLEQRPSRVTLTPLPSAETADACLSAAVARLGAPLSATLEGRSGIMLSETVPEIEDVPSALARLFDLFTSGAVGEII